MSDTTNGTGPSDVPDEEARRTDDLPDGSASGNATQDPQQDSDVDSGGEPAEPEEG